MAACDGDTFGLITGDSFRYCGDPCASGRNKHNTNKSEIL